MMHPLTPDYIAEVELLSTCEMIRMLEQAMRIDPDHEFRQQAKKDLIALYDEQERPAQ